jgi:hypothetical protein
MAELSFVSIVFIQERVLQENELTSVYSMSTRRIAAAGQPRPESGVGTASLPSARRAASRARQRVARPPRRPSRPGFGPPPRVPRSHSSNCVTVNRGWEVFDDFPEHLPVLTGELRVIENYLARLLDELLEPRALETKSSVSEPAKWDVE